MNLSESIKQKALALGFDIVGITNAEPLDPKEVEYLRAWLDAGYCGQMQYMHRNFAKRINPAKLLEGARSVICTGLSYRQATQKNRHSSDCTIANFALYEDYHLFIKKLLGELVDFMESEIRRQNKSDARYKICVDSVPFAERSFAQRAGLGFIGKNHMLINPTLGAQILLGEIITDIDLVIDEPMADHCPGCDKCARACPTGALGFDGSFDATRCISYLTIEHKGQTPDANLTDKIGTHLFGCDECILACPYELLADTTANEHFEFFPERQSLSTSEILDFGSEKFYEYFARSPVKRLGLERLKRNAQICLGNTRADQGTRKPSPGAQGASEPV